MNKKYLLLSIVLTSAVFTTIAMLLPDQLDPPEMAMAETTSAEQISPAQPSDQRLDVLESKVQALQSAIVVLEGKLESTHQTRNVEFDENRDTTSTDTPPVTNQPRVATNVATNTVTERLIAVGIDTWTAENIVRRRNEVDLAELELRDKAIREGYIGTKQFRKEHRALMGNVQTIRKEVGDDYFDRFLFVSGESNRIRVSSVMVGSAAESAGVEDGDLILAYDEQRLFNWNELQGVTTQGTRNESVNITVSRNGTEMNLTIPRGPMGVRLTPARVDPNRT